MSEARSSTDCAVLRDVPPASDRWRAPVARWGAGLLPETAAPTRPTGRSRQLGSASSLTGDALRRRRAVWDGLRSWREPPMVVPRPRVVGGDDPRWEQRLDRTRM